MIATKESNGAARASPPPNVRKKAQGERRDAVEIVLERLSAIRDDLLRLEREFAAQLATYAVHRKSARNLIHYLALRRHDLRELQEQLAALGLSSLGRTESHV
ncbi:MAG: pyruvate kinase, partial [Chthoniobacterales bacterium]